MRSYAAARPLGPEPMIGAQRGRSGWMVLARPLAHWQALFIVAAFVLLAASFVRNDFSVLYVASNSYSALPLQYRLAAVWGGHEGSLLLWLLMLNVWTVAVARYSARLPLAFAARILAVMGLVEPLRHLPRLLRLRSRLRREMLARGIDVFGGYGMSESAP